MFTGIIDHYGIIDKIVVLDKNLQFTINCQFSDLVLGESIAVDGICLTVTQTTTSGFICDISPETCRLTTAKHFCRGKKVNLERALRSNDRLGGHYVTGHIDGYAEILQRNAYEDYVAFTIGNFSNEQMTYLLRKGSIAINGVSLTINEVQNNAITIMLIPHTLTITNLNDLQANDLVNIEFDWLAKLFVNYMRTSLENTEKTI